MKRCFFSALLILIYTGNLAAQDNKKTEDAKQIRETCTNEAKDVGMEGEELKDYVEACVSELIETGN